MIMERTSMSVCDWLRLLRNKISVLWSSDNLHWAFHRTVENAPDKYVGLIMRRDAFNLLKDFNIALNGIMVIFLMAGLYKYKCFSSSKAYLPCFVFFSAFCAFLPIEVQPRYIYLPQLFVFAGAAYGVERLLKWRKKSENGQNICNSSLL